MLVAEGLSSTYAREAWRNKRHFRSNDSRSPRSALRWVVALDEDTDDPRHDGDAQERTRLTNAGVGCGFSRGVVSAHGLHRGGSESEAMIKYAPVSVPSSMACERLLTGVIPANRYE